MMIFSWLLHRVMTVIYCKPVSFKVKPARAVAKLLLLRRATEDHSLLMVDGVIS